ncbi:MAG: glycosyltransferase [Candidatus Lernaella stagnicola]|nr:glycosyltransferase [Candidatus Lernaella stagnicola]
MRVAVLGHTYVVDANRGKWRRLAARGHEVILFSPHQWRETDFGLRTFEVATDIEAHTFACPGHGHVRRYGYPFRSLLAAVRGRRVDVLVAETEPGGVASWQAALLAVSLGLSLLPFAWENLPLTGRSAWAARPVYTATRRLLVGSQGAAQTAWRAGYGGPVTVVPQVGVPVPSASRPAAEKGGTKTALFLARLDRKKGADLLLDALPHVAGWRAVIVGDGDERDNLQRQVESLGLAERVRFVGAVPHRDVPSWLAQADALVLPSRSVPGWVEQFGHVLAWAMSAGVPVVAARCGAIPEVVGEAGLLVPENDPRAIAATLAQLSDDHLAQRLRDAGRERAHEKYTDDAVARRLEKALVMALERDDGDVLD